MSTPAAWSPADSQHAITICEANAWRWAVTRSAQRIHDHGPDQQTDARLLLLALRQFIKAADLAAKVVAGTSQATGLTAERKLFDDALPGAKSACDVLEHFSEYAQGTGNEQQRGIPPWKRQPDRELAARDWPLGYDPATDAIRLGQHLVGVSVARDQVKVLNYAIWQAVRDG